MKLEIGKYYSISEKLKNAFSVNSKEAKIVSLSNGIVTLQIDGMAFPLKESIALTNLFTSYELTAQFTEEKFNKREEENENKSPVIVEDDVPESDVGVEPGTPEENNDENIPPEGVVETEPETSPEPTAPVDEEENEASAENAGEDGIPRASVEEIVEPEPEMNVDNSIVITVPEVDSDPESEIIEENPQDNPEPEYIPDEEYNPDDEWGF